MPAILNLALALALAVAIGLGGTWQAITGSAGVEVVEAGPWRAEIRIGTTSVNPYVRAAIARSGAVPTVATETLVFRAANDSGGRPLRGNCVYRLDGVWIDTRWWTLTVTDAEGRPAGAPGDPHALNSQGLVRRADGSFQITVSPNARPGNWLPSTASDRIGLVLRLYDTPLYTNGGLEDIALPAITREICLS